MNKRKKKKGFTLIELVIVLAVLAIIALIAIPNFTKVRNDSLAKADFETGAQIEKIALMAIADKDLEIDKSYVLQFDVKGKLTNVNLSGGTTALTNTDFKDMLKDVSKPQVNDKTNYLVIVDDKGNVKVEYSNANGGGAASIVK